jgi:hypothetical protein
MQFITFVDHDNMKDFNLKEALAGKPVITRDGKKVKQLTQFDSETSNLFGVVDNSLISWYNDGVYSSNYKSNFDLFMETENVSIWVNVYYDGDNIYIGHKHSIEQLALEVSKNSIHYIKTIEITNEK